MEDIVNSGLYQVLIQVIMMIQFICIFGLFLEKQKLTFRNIFYGLLAAVSLYAIFLLHANEISFYIVNNSIVLCWILHRGKILHKSLCIVVSFGINMVTEMLNKAFIDEFLIDYLPNERWEKLIIQLGSMILILVFVIILKNTNFLKRNKRAFEALPKKEIIALSILPLFSIAIVCMGVFIYTGKIQGINNTAFLCVVMVGAAVLDLSLLVIISHSARVDYYKKLNQIIAAQLNKQLTYYERLEKVNKETRAIKHDLRNHMLVINDLLENGEADELKSYISNITQSVINHKERVIQTGNPIADAILNEKYRVACEQKININVDLQLFKDMNIDEVDLCAILSNSIDNAIEACEKIEKEEDRTIKVIGRMNRGYLIIQVMNKIKDELIIVNNTIKTSKHDKKQHGHGLSNIKDSVAKYKGEFNISLKEQYFMMEVIINTSYV